MSIRQGYFRLGESIEISGTFRNGLGVLMDATGVTATLKKPDDTVTTPAVLTPTNGVVAYIVSADMAGTWKVRLSCSGPVPAVIEGQFVVVPSIVLPAA